MKVGTKFTILRGNYLVWGISGKRYRDKCVVKCVVKSKKTVKGIKYKYTSELEAVLMISPQWAYDYLIVILVALSIVIRSSYVYI